MYKEFTFSGFTFIGPISGGRIKKNILKAYPYLKAEDIDEALDTRLLWQMKKH